MRLNRSANFTFDLLFNLKLNKKGIIKASIISFIALAILGIIFLSFFSSANTEQTYKLGEEVKLDLKNCKNWCTIKIISPSQTSIEKTNKNFLLLKFNEPGNYLVDIKSNLGLNHLQFQVEEILEENEISFNFTNNTVYFVNTTLKLDFTKFGNYELIILSPSGKKTSRVSRNDLFFFELLEKGNYSFTLKRGNFKESLKFSVISINESIEIPLPKGELIQEKAEINKPVAWTKIINDTLIEIPNLTNLTLTKENGESFTDYNLTIINGKKYIQINESLSEDILLEDIKLEYLTESPKLEEKIISENKKEIIVSSPEDVHYEDILSYTRLPKEISNINLIKIYWKEQDKYLDFEAKDTNNNGLFDYVEWMIPHLSEQTFEIIIIIKAEHLASDRTFISDIYEQVRALDNIWSETIPAGDYVRVVFEKNITRENDITLYPRIVSGYPAIEVYEQNKDELIAKFENLTSNEYNQVILTNLIGEQNTFDLKIINGSVEFDYIVDPTLYVRSGVSSYTANTPTSVNFGTAMPNTQYSILFSGQQDTDAIFSIQYDSKSTGSFRIIRVHDDGGANESAGVEWASLSWGEYNFGGLLIKCNNGSGVSTSTTNFLSNFPNTNYSVVAYTPYDDDSARVSYSAKTTESWSSVILEDGGAAEVVSYIDWCAVSYGTSTVGGVTIKAGNDTLTGATAKVINFSNFGTFPDTDYVVVATASRTAGDPCEVEITGKTTTSFNVTAEDDDTTNNCGGREFNWIAISTGEENIDLTFPTFTKIPNNTSLFYGNESLWVDFDATDETGFGYYSVNDTRFSINSTGFLSNATILGVGNYSINITINDTTNNINWTIYKLSINKSKSNCLVYFNSTSPIIYPEKFIVYTTCGPSYNLFMNSTSIFNGSLINSGIGYFNFTAERIEDENYTYTSDTKFFTVNLNPEKFKVLFNATSPINYPETFLVWANASSDFILYRNETPITNNSEQINGAGYFIFLAQRIDEVNYTWINDETNFTVNKNPENCQVLFNETFPLSYKKSFIVWSNCSTPFELYRNGTFISNNSEQLLNAGFYNFSMLRSDSSNYSIYYNETILEINDPIPPLVNFGTGSPRNNSKFARDWIYIDASVIEDNEANITFDLYYSNYTLLNSSTYTDFRREITWANLSEGIYYYNITVFDLYNNKNSTLTRKVTLNFTLPIIYFIYPTEDNPTSRSRNWIYANVSASNLNEEVNITFRLYNSSGLVNQSIFTNPTREINWTNLPEGTYNYNVTLFDNPDGEVSTLTRVINLDRTPPNATLISPEDNLPIFYFSQNLIAEITDTFGLSNLTLLVYNKTNLINKTEQVVLGKYSLTEIPYNFEYEGIFNWSYQVFDLAGNFFNTSNFTLIYDLTFPKIDYISSTEEDYVNKSQNFIYVNVSVLEENEANITFDLYYSNYTLLNSSTYTDFRREINWTELPDGIYYYNVTIIDLGYNLNSTLTRQIGLDIIPPNATLILPSNNSFLGNSTQNLTVNMTDNFGLSNSTLFIYNQIGDLINETTSITPGTALVFGVVYTFLNDGIFNWFYKVFDLAGNTFETQNNTLTIDTTPPLLNYGSGTPVDFANVSHNWIYVSAYLIEDNFVNVTFDLYDASYTLLNSTTYTDSRRNINFTSLTDGSYYYNITSFDLLNHSNNTQTRKITIDTSNPNLYLRSGTSSYTSGTPTEIGFTNEMLDIGYSILFSGQQDTDAIFSIQYDKKATTGFRINRVHDDGGANESAGVEWAALSWGEHEFGNLLIKCNNGSGVSTSTTNFLSNFPNTNYSVVAYTPYDDDSARVSYSAKTAGSWSSAIVDDGGAAEVVPYTDWCAVSYGTSTVGGVTIKAGNDTLTGATAKLINFSNFGTFPDTNYVVVATASRVGAVDACEVEITGKTTTSFNVTAEDDDTTNNCGGREFNWIAISRGEFLIDSVPPEFTFIPLNASLFYENESLGVDFDATDETEFGYYSVNDTRFSINQTGFLSNTTPLGVGTYLINVTINDTSNNIVWIFYQVQIFPSLSLCSVYFNEISPVTYPTTFNAYTNCNSQHILALNGTVISNGSTIDSGATAYNISVQRIDNINYTNSFDQKQFIINKNPEECQVLFNETFPLESSTPFLVWSNCSTSFELYRNGTFISNNSEQILKLGAYNFSMLRLDSSNYSIYYNETQIIMEDTIFPLVDFGISSPKNNSKFARDWIYIDASVIEDNEANITFDLYYSNYTLLNSSTYTDFRREINWTNLPEGAYYFNITVFDLVSHSNSTLTKKIILNFTLPSMDFVYPTEDNGISITHNWIYVNVSTSNINEEINITFSLYNSSGLVNQSIFTNSIREINWTELPEGVYYYNVSLFDNPEGIFSTLTRTINLDITNPNATLLNPENNTYTSISEQNLTINITDNLGLSNSTLFIYNQIGDLINETTSITPGTTLIFGVVYTFLNDGIFNWFYKIFDLAGNTFETQNNTLIIDTTYPQINFTSPTEEDYINKSQNFIYVNVSVTELNEANITFDLYYSNYTLLNSSTYTDLRREINWTDLPEGIYYYNVTIIDLANNQNYTSTRQIGLDTLGPIVTIINPKPKTYTYNESLPLDYTILDSIGGVSACWWNLDNQINQSISCGANTTFDTSEGPHTLYFYSNDTFNQLSINLVSFSISLTGPAVTLISPFNNTYLNYNQNILFNYTASDPDGIDICSLYGNFTENWHLNQTDYIWISNISTTFFDNFEDNNIGSNWTNTAWVIASDRAQGTYSTKCATNANCDINTNLNLDASYTPWINLTFRYNDDDCDAGDVILYFNDSSGNWDNMGNIDAGTLGAADDTWNTYSLSVTDSQYNHSGFAIRFWADPDAGTGDSSENYWVDNINITYIIREYIVERNSSFLVNIIPDGNYIWNVRCNDSLGYSSFALSNNSFTIDTTYPQINFILPTEEDYVNKSHNFIYVNVSVTEINEKNITFDLYYSNYTLLNSSTYTDFRREINWTELPDGIYYYNVTIFDYANYSNFTETRKITLDTTYPLIEFILPTELNDTDLERDWIYANVSVLEENEANITFSLYYLNGTLINSSTYTDFRREINWTSLEAGNYSYNVTISDYAGLINFTETRLFNIFMIVPVINLIYPEKNYNFSGYLIDYFNYSIEDNSSILNCSLYGNFTGNWHLNQTSYFPQRIINQNFSAVTTIGDGYYSWNIECFDIYGNYAFNSTNFTLSTFLPPDSPNTSLVNISQTINDGTGEIILQWNKTAHNDYYKIYSTDNLSIGFTLLVQTKSTNYTDTTANTTQRRFYRISNTNPLGENFSNITLGKTVYYLERKPNVNTRNWIGFYLINNLTTANDSLNEISNITSFNLWNETIQKRVICNNFSCPDFPSCTDTNCNFDLQDARGYEVSLNLSSPIITNWSFVGILNPPNSINLIKNTTSFGKNWISIYANTSSINANKLISSVSYADAVTNWNSSQQTSQGYIYMLSPPPGFPPYTGINFQIQPEKAYEVSVTQNTLYTQT